MAEQKQRAHRATYSSDKKKGGYVIRVVGPHASTFAGREIPVYSQSAGEEKMEKLTRLLWSGTDDGSVNPQDAGKPTALYAFEPRPRDEQQVEF